jgi:hypothetical protein
VIDPYIPKLHQASVVLLGSFNPAIFHPRWFGSVGAFTDAEVRLFEEGKHLKPDDLIITTEIAQLRLASRFNIVAQRESIQITDQNPPFNWLKDFVECTFSALPHTPVRAAGLNRELHFAIETKEAWWKIGDILVPKAPWEFFFQGHLATDVEHKAGLVNVTMRVHRVDKEWPGFLDLRVFVSNLGDQVLGIATNDHFDLSARKNDGALNPAIDAVRTHWLKSFEKSERLVNDVMKLAKSYEK